MTEVERAEARAGLTETTDTTPLAVADVEPGPEEVVSEWLGSTATGEIRTTARRKKLHRVSDPALAAATALICLLSVGLLAVSLLYTGTIS